MNRAYRLVWRLARRIRVAASEKSRGRSKKGLRLSAVALSLLPIIGHASPIGGQVVSGIGTISQSANLTTINQASQKLSLDWKSFNVAPKETVNFVQPNVSSIAVNRIYDTNGTQILGHLNANGQVWLINPNGILFGKTAQVNVGGLVAATLDSINHNGSSVSFSGSGKGAIVNEGTINGNYVALIGNTVSNAGSIVANLGTAALGAGSSVTLTFSGNDLVKMQVDKGVLNSLVANGGVVRADGGYLIMSAGAKDELLASVVNNTGIVRAETVQDRNGIITLLGGMTSGTVNVSGTLDASAPNGGNGGFIETSAHNVKIAIDAKVTTLANYGLNGTWLIDPVDFTIAASGGNETGAQLVTALGSGNVTIQSTSGTTAGNGDVNVNDSVSWSANTLTLNAQNNININAAMTGSGTAKLALRYGQASSTGGTSTYNVNAAVNLPAGNNFSTQLGSAGAAAALKVIALKVTAHLESVLGGQLSGGVKSGNGLSSGASRRLSGPSTTITEVNAPSTSGSVSQSIGGTGSLNIVNGGLNTGGGEQHDPNKKINLNRGQGNQ